MTTRRDRLAHIMRRCIHVSMLAIPVVYYYFLTPNFSTTIVDSILLIFLLIVIVFETLRLRAGLVLFGQRVYEKKQVSAFAWTMSSMVVVLFLSPSAAFTMAIVATCAFVDPLLGEMRSHQCGALMTIFSGLFVALLIWLGCAWFYHFPLRYAVILAPISVIVENPTWRWIDDNALMLLVPLGVVWGLLFLVR